MIGNPPFLGGKLLITYLGEDYVSRMFETYAGHVPAEADLVCYWFEKAGKQIASGKAKRAGLVATNSIRGAANRRALQAATTKHRSYEAWSDEPWVNDGAAVRVSLICFSAPHDESVGGARLDGESVDEIYTDLTARRGVRDPLAGGHDDGQEQTNRPTRWARTGQDSARPSSSGRSSPRTTRSAGCRPARSQCGLDRAKPASRLSTSELADGAAQATPVRSATGTPSAPPASRSKESKATLEARVDEADKSRFVDETGSPSLPLVGKTGGLDVLNRLAGVLAGLHRGHALGEHPVIRAKVVDR